MYQITNVTQQVGILLQNLAVEGDNVIKNEEIKLNMASEEQKSNQNQSMNSYNNLQNEPTVPVLCGNQRFSEGSNQYLTQNNQKICAQNENRGNQNIYNQANYVEINRPVANLGDNDDQIQQEDNVVFADSQQNQYRIGSNLKNSQRKSSQIQINSSLQQGNSSNQMGANSQIPNVSAFESEEQPKIPAGLYFHILCQKLNLPCERTIIVLALIERLCNKGQTPKSNFYNNQKEEYVHSLNTQISINSLTIHRLILVSVLVTQKFYNDVFYGNSYVAKIGGISLEELNCLEEIFLGTIDWQLIVNMDEYNRFNKALSQFFNDPLQPQVIKIIDDIFKTIQILETNPQALEHTEEDTTEPEFQESDDQSANQEMIGQDQENNNTEMYKLVQQQYLNNVQQLVQIENVLQVHLAQLQQQVCTVRTDISIEAAQMVQVQSIQQLYQQTQQLTQVQIEITNQISQFEAIGQILQQQNVNTANLQQALQGQIQQQNMQAQYQLNQNNQAMNNMAHQIQQPMADMPSSGDMIEQQNLETLFIFNQQLQQSLNQQQEQQQNQFSQSNMYNNPNYQN